MTLKEAWNLVGDWSGLVVPVTLLAYGLWAWRNPDGDKRFRERKWLLWLFFGTLFLLLLANGLHHYFDQFGGS
jgi:hypothetical protein